MHSYTSRAPTALAVTMPKTHERKRMPIQTLKHMVEKLQRSLSLPKPLSLTLCRDVKVPKDVKEGHFVVLAVDDDRRKRFVVALKYLNHPQFLMLLEQAEEEFGFDNEGALAIPCRPSELERILGEHWKEERRNGNGDGACKTMVDSW